MLSHSIAPHCGPFSIVLVQLIQLEMPSEASSLEMIVSNWSDSAICPTAVSNAQVERFVSSTSAGGV